jgi:hypothetical protein
MVNTKLNFELLIKNILKISHVKKVHFSNSLITIIYDDDFILYLKISYDDYHKFYTFLNDDNINYYYRGEMPHEKFKDVYAEITRMSQEKTRVNICRSRYLKMY